MTYLKPGAYPDLSLGDYLAITDRDGWPAVRNGLLRAVRHGPRECQHRQRFGITPTKSMLAGTLVHTQVLSPQDWLRRFVEWKAPVLEPREKLDWKKISPDRYATLCGRYQLDKEGKLWLPSGPTSYDREIPAANLAPPGTVAAAKAACKAHYEQTVPRVPKLDDDGKPKLQPQNPRNREYQEFLRANPGRIIVTGDQIKDAQLIATAIRDNPDARRLLGQIWRTEYTIVWRDPETGTLMACRHDWLTDPRGRLVTLGELKTCRSAEEGAFNRQAGDMEYYAQAAHYRAGFRAQFGEHIETESVCLAVENNGSHDSCVFTWDPSPGRELDAGAKLNAERLQQLLEWRDEYGRDQWPCRRTAAIIDFGSHGRGQLLGEDDDDGLDWGDRRQK